jgi:hypothetical protein
MRVQGRLKLAAAIAAATGALLIGGAAPGYAEDH